MVKKIKSFRFPGGFGLQSMTRGLSIIELLVVMVILTILAGLAVTTYSGVLSRNRVKTAKNIMASYRKAMEAFKANAHEGTCDGAGSCILSNGCPAVPVTSSCATQNVGGTCCGSTTTKCYVDGFYPDATCVTSYADFYSKLSPYLSGDYGRYFDTSSFSYQTSIIDTLNLNRPTAYTLVLKANVSDPSLLTATHKDLAGSYNGEILK